MWRLGWRSVVFWDCVLSAFNGSRIAPNDLNDKCIVRNRDALKRRFRAVLRDDRFLGAFRAANRPNR